MTEHELNERKGLYMTEWQRLTTKLSETDPLSEEYKTISARVYNLEKTIEDLDKAYFEETMRLREFDFKTSKESFEEDLAADKAYYDHERMKADLLKAEIGSTESFASNLLKVGGCLAQSYFAGKCMLAVAKGILSDEESGKLVFSKVLGFISKPSVWNFRV